MKCLDGRLILPPLNAVKMKEALDLGCGAGTWAIDVANTYPQCKVRTMYPGRDTIVTRFPPGHWNGHLEPHGTTDPPRQLRP